MPSWTRAVTIGVTVVVCTSILYITGRDSDVYHASITKTKLMWDVVSDVDYYPWSFPSSSFSTQNVNDSNKDSTPAKQGYDSSIQLQQNASASSAPSQRNTTIGMLTVLYGDRNPAYERALKTHQVHSKTHGYELHILRHEMIDGLFNKISWILHILMTELKKPASQRLEWIFWFDADTVIINPLIPLTLFLPPQPTFSHIHLLYNNDWNGLNNGVFFLRVHPWSQFYMTSVLALRHYLPTLPLPFPEQTAMAHVMSFPPYKHNTTLCPQRWFNAYHHSGYLNSTIEPFQVRRGDMLVHFAGIGDKASVANQWSEIAEQHLSEWELEAKYTALPREVKDFWDMQERLLESEHKEWKEVVQEALGLVQGVKQVVGKLQGDEGTGDVEVEEEVLGRVRDEMVKLTGMCESVVEVEEIRKGVVRLQEARTPILQALERANKEKIRKAFQAIRQAENLLANTTTDSATVTHVPDIRAQLSTLKDLLVAVPEDPAAIQAARVDLEKVIAEHLEEMRKVEESRKLEELAVLGGTEGVDASSLD